MSKGKSGCAKGAMGCAGVGCFLVIGAVVLGFAFSPQIKEVFQRGVAKAKRAVEKQPVYREALARAEADPRVMRKLGTPIEASLPSSMNIQHSIGRGSTVEIELKIHGPEGEGKLEVRGSERDGEVTFDVLRFWKDGEGLDLLKATGNVEAPPGEGGGG